MKQSRSQYMKNYRKTKADAETESSKLVKELTASYRTNRRLIEDAMTGLPKGTKVYLDHVTALDRLARSHRAELAARGLVPTNLGVGSTPQWVFIARVTSQGAAYTVQIDPQKLDQELRNQKAENAARIAKNITPEAQAVRHSLDVEFGLAPSSDEDKE